MRALAVITGAWLAASAVAVIVGWRIASYRNRVNAARDVIAAAERIVRVEQSRMNHPSNWGNR